MHAHIKRFCITCLTLLTAACAPMDPGAPAVAPLTGQDLALSAAAPGLPWPATQWWQRYQDPQLDRLIREALAHSPSLQSAVARVHMAQAAARGARAVQWPQINASYRHTRERLSENALYPPPLGGSYQTDVALSLQLHFDPDLWGRQRALTAAAQHDTAAAQAAQAQAHNLLVAAVAQAYFQLQNAQSQSTAIADIVDKLQEVLSITRQRHDNGLGTQVDVDQAQSAVSSAHVQLSQVRNTVVLLHHQLAALLGKAPAQLPLPTQRSQRWGPTDTPEAIPLALLGRRPDITAARQQALAAGARISASQADFLPNIDLSAAVGYASLGLDKLFRSGSADYHAGPVITLPIFNAGALNAQLAGRRAERDAAIAQYNQTVLAAIREVADVQASLRSLQEQTRHQEASLRAISSAYDIARQRYRAGLGDFIQVLMAQSEMLKQTVQTGDLHAQAYVLDIQLAAALGGGYTSSETS